MQQELRELQPQLVETSKETEQLMVKIEKDTVEAEAKKEVVAADEAVANQAAAKAKGIKDECESDLAEALPALEAAIAALNTLTPKDITLVKAMKVMYNNNNHLPTLIGPYIITILAITKWHLKVYTLGIENFWIPKILCIHLLSCLLHMYNMPLLLHH